MTWAFSRSRESLRRSSVSGFVRRMAERHPELTKVVGFREMMAMAKRDGVTVQLVSMPAAQHGQLLRIWGDVFVQINRKLTRAEQTATGMHELCHFWRDDPGVACYYSDGETGGARDEFADIFAWTVTSPARVHVPGLREEDVLNW